MARGLALREAWGDDRDDLRDAFYVANRDPERSLALEGIRAVGLVLAGQPIDSLRIGAGVMRTTSNMSLLAADVGLAEALAHSEIGDRDRAAAELGRDRRHPGRGDLVLLGAGGTGAR